MFKYHACFHVFFISNSLEAFSATTNIMEIHFELFWNVFVKAAVRNLCSCEWTFDVP